MNKSTVDERIKEIKNGCFSVYVKTGSNGIAFEADATKMTTDDKNLYISDLNEDTNHEFLFTIPLNSIFFMEVSTEKEYFSQTVSITYIVG